MKIARHLLLALIALGMAAACSTATPAPDAAPAEPSTDEQAVAEPTDGEPTDEAQAEERSVRELLEQAANGEHRSEANRARNRYRNPVETLEFFGLQPDMRVIELAPGAGWYTEVIAPVLRDNGEYFAAMPESAEPDSYFGRILAQYQAMIEATPALFDHVQTAKFSPPDVVELGPANSADLVVSFRSIHGWNSRGVAPQVLSAVYDVLKPGGTFGLVAHRAADGANPEESAKGGYLPEATVIELVEAAGFELVERSEINANPRDDRNHPEGVWTLPPTLRLGDQDREKYEAIGESDRMTLKFRKPATQAQPTNETAEQADDASAE